MHTVQFIPDTTFAVLSDFYKIRKTTHRNELLLMQHE